MTTASIAIIVGAMFGLGLFLCLYGYFVPAQRVAGAVPVWRRMIRMQSFRRLAYAALAGVAVLIITRWIVFAAVTMAAVLVIPAVMAGSGRANRASIAKLTAWAEWVERIRDTTVSGLGLPESLLRASSMPPEYLEDSFLLLASRLRIQGDISSSLRWLADELDDPLCDQTIACLIMNAGESGPRLQRVLTDLAAHTRSMVEARQELEAWQRGRRFQVLIVLIVVGLVCVFQAISPAASSAFDSLLGQVAMAVAFGLIAGGLAIFVQLMTVRQHERFISEKRTLLS